MSQQPSQYVYILYNEYTPFVYKIGHTKRTPQDRAKEISRDTGSPGSWLVAHFWCVEDSKWLEQRLHLHFKKHRISRNEMFHFENYSVEQVADMISQFIGNTGESPKRAAELRELRRQEEKQRFEKEKIERQKVLAREAECRRLHNEISSLVKNRIKNETPLFASPDMRQAIKNYYIKYQNLPADLEQLRKLKYELSILAAYKHNNEQSNSGKSENWVYSFLGIAIFGTIAFLMIDSSSTTQPSQKMDSQESVTQNNSIQVSFPDQTAETFNKEETQIETNNILPKSTDITIQESSFHEDKRKEAEKLHFDTILSVHPDVESIIESNEFDAWINNQPENLKSHYKYIIYYGNTSQVIGLLSAYKAASFRTDFEPIQMPVTLPEDTSSQAIYEKYQKPILPQDPTLITQPSENMPELLN